MASYKLFGSVNASSNAIWSGGSYQFTPIKNDTVWYTPTPEERESGSATLYLEARSKRPECGFTSDFDTILLTFVNPPSATSSPDTNICEGSTVTLNASGGTKYKWNTNDTTTSITVNPDTTTVYWVEILEGCVVRDTINVIVTQEPRISFTAGEVFTCFFKPYTFESDSLLKLENIDLSTILWEKTGNGQLLNAKTLTPTYVFGSETDSAQLIVSAKGISPCETVVKETFLTLRSVPVPKDTIYAEVCEGDFFILPSGKEFPAYSDGNYTIYDTVASNNQYTCDSIITSYLTVYPTYEDTLKVNICKGIPYTLSSDSLVYTPGIYQDTTYTVHGCDSTVWTIVTVVDPPIISAGQDNDEECFGTGYSLSAANINYSDSLRIAWTHNGHGNFNDSTLLNPVYTSTDPLDSIDGVDLVLNVFVNTECVLRSDTLHLTYKFGSISYEDTIMCFGSTYIMQPENIPITTAGIYKRTYKAINGCDSVIMTNLRFTDQTKKETINADFCKGSYYVLADSSIKTLPDTYEVRLKFKNAPKCDSVVITYNLNEVQPPSISNSLRLDSTCYNRPYTVRSAIAINNFSKYTWTVINGVQNNLKNTNTLKPTYTSQESELGDTVILRLTAYGLSNCTFISDSIALIIKGIGSAEITTGDLVSACTNDTIFLEGVTKPGYGDVIWKKLETSDGYIEPADTLRNNLYYRAGENDKLNGKASIQLDFYSACGILSDTLTITYTESPIVTLKDTDLMCDRDTSIQLGGNVSGNYTQLRWKVDPKIANQIKNKNYYFSKDNIRDPNYFPSYEEKQLGYTKLILTASNGSCYPSTDTLYIRFVKMPTVTVSIPDKACIGSSIPLRASVDGGTGKGYWSRTIGTGTFDPDTLTLDATILYRPSEADLLLDRVGFKFTTISDGTCFPKDYTKDVLLFIRPDLSISADKYSICSNNAHVLLNRDLLTHASKGIWTSSAAGEFSTSDSIPNPSFELLDTTQREVLITYTVLDGCELIDTTLTLKVYPAPKVSAGKDTFLCIGTTEISLIGQISGFTKNGFWKTLGNGTFSSNQKNTVYTFGTADAKYVDLILYSSDNLDCNPVSDTMRVYFTTEPTVDAGYDGPITICANDTLPLKGKINSTFGTGLWSVIGSNGNYQILPSDTSVSLAYFIPDPLDFSKNYITIRLLTTKTCKPKYDGFTVKILEAPEVDAKPDETIRKCNTALGNISISALPKKPWDLPLRWTTSGNGTFISLNADSTEMIYKPGTLDTLNTELWVRTTQNGNCKPAWDKIILQVEKSHNVSAGTTTPEICSNDSARLQGKIEGGNGKGYWSVPEGNKGSFYPSANEINAKYIPSPHDTGNIILTLISDSTGVCPQDTSKLNVYVKPGPEAIINNLATICFNNPVLNIDGDFKNATGAKWQSMDRDSFEYATHVFKNNIYYPSALEMSKNTFNLLLITTGGECPQDTGILKVNVTQPPKIEAGSLPPSCRSDLSVFLPEPFLDPLTTQILWSNLEADGTLSNATSISGAKYTFGTLDKQRLQVKLLLETRENGLCKPVRDTLIIDIADIPDVLEINDINVCSDATEVPLQGIVTGKPGTGRWSRTDGLEGDYFSPSADSLLTIYKPTPDDISAKSVGLTLTSTDACRTDEENLVINFIPKPEVTVSNDTLICETETSIKINASISGGSWKSKFGNKSFSPSQNSQSATYTFNSADKDASSTYLVYAVRNDYCETVTDTMFISFARKPVLSLSVTDTACVGMAIPVTANLSGGSGKGFWKADSIFTDNTSRTSFYHPSYKEIKAGIANVTFTTLADSVCAIASASQQIVLKPLPKIYAGDDKQICANNPYVRLKARIDEGATKGIWTTSGTENFVGSNTNLITYYRPSLTDISNDSIKFWFTTTDACNNISDELVISVGPAPKVEAGKTIYICQEETKAALIGSVTGPTTLGRWSTIKGKGYFSNIYDPNAIYYLRDSDFISQKVTLYLTSENNGDCNEVTDSVDIIITGRPEITANGDTLICANDTSRLIGTISDGTKGRWSSNGLGKFIPNDTAPKAGYVPARTDQYLTKGLWIKYTLIESCISKSDSFQVKFKPSPEIILSDIAPVCETETKIENIKVQANKLAIPLSWKAAGPITNIDSVTVDYEPVSADKVNGIAQIIVSSPTIGNCFTSDTIKISIRKKPIVEAGDPISICSNTTAELIGNITGGTEKGFWKKADPLSDGYFTENIDSLKNYFKPGAIDSAKGFAWLRLVSGTDGICKADSDTVIINILPAPLAKIDVPDTTICYSRDTVFLNGSVENAGSFRWHAPGGGRIVPSATSQIAYYFPSSQDYRAKRFSVYLEATGFNNCTTSTAEKTVHVLPRPIVDAGDSLKIVCTGTSSVDIRGLGNAARWKTIGDGSVNPLYTPGKFSKATSELNNFYIFSKDDTAKKLVFLVLESTNNGNCEPVTDTLEIRITSIPEVFAGPNDTVCSNNANVELKGRVIGGSGKGFWSAINAQGEFLDENKDTCTYVPGLNDTRNEKIKLVFTALESCRNVSDELDIIIYQAPTISAGPDNFYCKTTQTINLEGTGVIPPPYTGIFSWAGTGENKIQDSLSLKNAKYELIVNDTIHDSIRFTLTLRNYRECRNITDDKLVYFKSKPTARIVLPTAQCVNTLLQFRDSSDVPYGTIENYKWTIDGVTYPENDSIAFYKFNTGGNKKVTLNIETDKKCNDSVTKTIYVRPLPEAGFKNTQLCNKTEIQFTGTPDTLINWNWDFGNGYTGTGIKPEPQEYTTTGSYTIKINATDRFGCADTTIETIRINSNPQADFIFGNICLGNETIFRNRSTIDGDTIKRYSWFFGNGDSSNIKNPKYTYMTLKESAKIMLVAATLTCSDTIVKAADVLCEPKIEATDTTVCSFGVVDFNASYVYKGDPDDVEYQWKIGNRPLKVTVLPNYSSMFTNTDTIIKKEWVKVTVVVPGCTQSDSVLITVYPLPKVTLESKENVCSGDSLQIMKIKSVNADSFGWFLEEKFISSSKSNTLWVPFTNTSFTSQAQKVKLISQKEYTFNTDKTVCSDTTEKTVLVYGLPQATITSNPQTSACHGQSVKFESITGGASYIWNYGDNKIDTAGSTVFHTFANTTDATINYNIGLTFKNQQGCTGTTSPKTLEIKPSPKVGFTFDTISGCTPFTPRMWDTTRQVISREWKFPDNSTSTDSIISNKTFLNNDLTQKTFDVTLKITNNFGCKDSSSGTFNIYPLPVANFETDKKEGCTPLTIKFKSTSTNAAQFRWTLDNVPSNNENPTHTFINEDLQNNISKSASLTVFSSFGCKSAPKSLNDIVIYPGPTGSFQLDKSGGCSPHSVNVTNSSANAILYEWVWGEKFDTTRTTTKEKVSQVFRNVGDKIENYTIQLVTLSSNGCRDTVIQTVEVLPAIEAKFKADTFGCSPEYISFVADTGTNKGVTYKWEFDNGKIDFGTTATTLYETFGDKPKEFKPRLVTISGVKSKCTDTTFKSVWIHPKPKADFSIDKSSGCSPLTVSLSDSTSLGEFYIWDFGDGKIVTSGTFGDSIGSSETSKKRTHIYNDTLTDLKDYQLKLKVTTNNGRCFDTASATVRVFPSVKASFTSDVDSSCTPLNVTFTNTSDKVFSYYWTFGDGTFSNEVNPTHSFVNSSSNDIAYTVKLKITSYYGCEDSITKDDKYIVYATPEPKFIFPNHPNSVANMEVKGKFPVAHVEVRNETKGKNRWNYFWDFGNGTTTTFPDPGEATYDEIGAYIVRLLAYNEHCRDTFRHTITVFAAKPIAIYHTDDTLFGCVPKTLTFVNNSVAGDRYKWNFGDGSSPIETTNKEDVEYTYKFNGNFTVTLSAINSTDMDEVDTISITVHPKPNLFFLSPPVVEEYAEVKLINISYNAASYLWDFGDKKFDTVPEPSHYYTNPGDYKITLYGVSEYGCVDSFTNKGIKVEPSCIMLFPNAFTPSKMGPSGGKYDPDVKEKTNDIFHPKFKNVESYELQIFSRWGELLFISKDLTVGWDGYFRNTLVKDDVYIWKAKIKCFNGRELLQTGTVALIR